MADSNLAFSSAWASMAAYSAAAAALNSEAIFSWKLVNKVLTLFNKASSA